MKHNNSMAKKETALTIPDEIVMNEIYYISGQRFIDRPRYSKSCMALNKSI